MQQLWKPTRFERYDRGYDTSMQTCRIVTDCGPAYIKAMGNPEGPHALACEWVGSLLARWFGLPTFDFNLMALTQSDEIPFLRGGCALPGPAFVTKAVPGHCWGGDARELRQVENTDDIAPLVVFDTWVRNCDRYPPDPRKRRPNWDNVFLAQEGAAPGKLRLIAIDHSHCFTCGRALTDRTGTIDRVKDERIYGLFPQFKPYVTRERTDAAVRRLSEVSSGVVNGVVSSIPSEWDVSEGARDSLKKLICERASFLADRIIGLLEPLCWPQQELDFGPKGGRR